MLLSLFPRAEGLDFLTLCFFMMTGASCGEATDITGPLFAESTQVTSGFEMSHVQLHVDFKDLLVSHEYVVSNLSANWKLTYKNSSTKGAKEYMDNIRYHCDLRLSSAKRNIYATASLLGLDLSVIEPLSVTDNSLKDKKRDKRQLGIIATIFGIGDAILSAYTWHQLVQLRAELRSSNKLLHERVDNIVVTMLRHDRAIEKLSESVIRLADIIEESRILISYSELTDVALTMYEHSLDDLRLAVVSLAGGLLTPMLYPLEPLTTVLGNLSEKAKERKKELVTTNPYRYQFSALVEGFVLHVLIHIPVISEPFYTFKLINLP